MNSSSKRSDPQRPKRLSASTSTTTSRRWGPSESDQHALKVSDSKSAKLNTIRRKRRRKTTKRTKRRRKKKKID